MPIISPGIFFDEESKLCFFNCQHVLAVLEKVGVDAAMRSKVTKELIEHAFEAENRVKATERHVSPLLRPSRNEQREWRIE